MNAVTVSRRQFVGQGFCGLAVLASFGGRPAKAWAQGVGATFVTYSFEAFKRGPRDT
jgi:hypothetical protein